MARIAPRLLRWESPKSYFTARLHMDLLGDWIVECVWGARGSAVGKTASLPVADKAQADAVIEMVHSRRMRHDYRLVSDRHLQ